MHHAQNTAHLLVQQHSQLGTCRGIREAGKSLHTKKRKKTTIDLCYKHSARLLAQVVVQAGSFSGGMVYLLSKNKLP